MGISIEELFAFLTEFRIEELSLLIHECEFGLNWSHPREVE